MIRRACYMMSYVAFESFTAFSFLYDGPCVLDFPNFRASQRTVQYATFMVTIAARFQRHFRLIGFGIVVE